MVGIQVARPRIKGRIHSKRSTYKKRAARSGLLQDLKFHFLESSICTGWFLTLKLRRIGYPRDGLRVLLAPLLWLSAKYLEAYSRDFRKALDTPPEVLARQIWRSLWRSSRVIRRGVVVFPRTPWERLPIIHRQTVMDEGTPLPGSGQGLPDALKAF
jgi:hypothetical protein